MRTSRDKGGLQAERLVQENYSTQPVQVLLGGREYWIPMNYMTPFGNKPTKMTPKFGEFFAFLPDFIGYTKDNYRDPMNKNKISVAFGDQFGFPPERKFKNGQQRGGISKQASGSEYGLNVYARNVPNKFVMVGTRRSGEFFMLECSEYSPERGVVRPSCSAQYPNAELGVGLFYNFHRDHLEKWREIDERINSLILSWQKK
jgi:hypothetical protein